MKRVKVLVAGAFLCGAGAWAQPNLEAYRGMKVSTRPVCEERCNRVEFGENTSLIDLESRISQLRYEAKQETDADKRKALQEQEQKLTERRERQVARMCKYICANNPEN